MKTREEIDDLMGKAVEAGLDGLDFMARFTYEDLANGYNGIGPEFLPETIRAKVSSHLALFAPAALIHDMRYSVGDGTRQSFNFANYEFRDNALKLADAAFPWYSWRRYRARAVALVLFDFVSSQSGWVAFSEASRKNLVKER